MASTERPQPLSRDFLSESGWTQGSLLPAGADVRLALWVHPENQGTKIARRAIADRTRRGDTPKRPLQVERIAKQDDRLIVLSHTCDLVKEPNDFPQVDVGLALVTDNASTIAQAENLGSAQFYLLRQLEDGRATARLSLAHNDR